MPRLKLIALQEGDYFELKETFEEFSSGSALYVEELVELGYAEKGRPVGGNRDEYWFDLLPGTRLVAGRGGFYFDPEGSRDTMFIGELNISGRNGKPTLKDENEYELHYDDWKWISDGSLKPVFLSRNRQ